MPKIDVDDDVYAALAERAVGFDTPNEVLRRMLLPPNSGGAPSARMAAPSSPPGSLAFLITQGLVEDGDQLRHEKVRSGQTFTATVESDGWIKTDVRRYKEPSPALGDLVGTQIDGWAFWTHVPSGKTLRQLSEEGGRPRGRRP